MKEKYIAPTVEIIEVAVEKGYGSSYVGIDPDGIGDLAQLYYPDRDYNSALRLFDKDLCCTRGLWNALRTQGYKPRDRLFTRSQVRIIVKYLGEP